MISVQSENIEKLMESVYRYVVPVTDKIGGIINQFIGDNYNDV